VEQACLVVVDYVDFHAVGEAFCKAVMPLVAFWGLVHLTVAFPFLIFHGAWYRDDRGIEDCSLLHRQAICLEMGLDRLEYLIAKVMLHKQVPERQDRGLIREPVSEQGDAGKSAYRRHFDQRDLNRRIAQEIPLLHQVGPQHAFRQIGRRSTKRAGLGIVRLNPIDQFLPRSTPPFRPNTAIAVCAFPPWSAKTICLLPMKPDHGCYHIDFRAGSRGFPKSP
jgi:hypothetical protein